MIDHQHLRLFQFCDSQFPTGAFSHSFGLETYIQRETVHDTETFIKWLHLFINEQLTYSDGLAMRIVYHALINNDKDKILDINQNSSYKTYLKKRVLALSKWVRMVKLALDLYDSEWIQWYYNQMKTIKLSFILLCALLC